MRLTRYRFGGFELDPASRELSRDGLRVPLPPKSLDCLTYLIEHRERAVGRDELISAVWGRVEVSDTVVAQTLLRARKALGDTGNLQSMIRTVPRFGYQWVAPVEEAGGDAPPQDRAAEATATAAEAAAAQTGAFEPPAAEAAVAPAAQALPATRGYRPLALGMLVLVLALLAASTWWRAQRGGEGEGSAEVTPANDAVLVLPVGVAPGDNENAWVRLGAMEYIAGRLRRAGLKVLPSDQTLHLSVQFGDRPDSEALARMQAASGARWIVLPEAEHDAQGWQLRLTLRGGEQREQVIRSRGSTPLAAAAAASDSWLHRLGLATDGAGEERVPSELTERIQRIDAELLAGQIAAARQLIEGAPPPQRDDPRLKVREGQLEYRAGRMAEAADIFAAILALQPAVAPDIRAKALMGQGAIGIRGGDLAAAEARYSDALQALQAVPQRVDDPALLGNAYNGRGVARVQQGKMDAAIQDMGLARIAMQRSGDFVEAAMVGSNLGIIEVRRGHFPQAVQEFDGAIAVFERYGVKDYLAATLMAKADAQLAAVQPAEAAATIDRAAALVDGLEDAFLASRIHLVHARVLIANGRLEEAADRLGVLVAANPDAASTRELQLRLLLARGAFDDAGALARRMPDAGQGASDGWILASVQAALRAGDIASARAWRALLSADAGSATASAIADALIARREGDMEGAIRASSDATAGAEKSGEPDQRVQAGLLQARLMLDSGRFDAAAARIGDLDAFARADYRVAWMALALYRAMGDATMVSRAQSHLDEIRGERDVEVEPIL